MVPPYGSTTSRVTIEVLGGAGTTHHFRVVGRSANGSIVRSALLRVRVPSTIPMDGADGAEGTEGAEP
jgi:hypothetical protein